MKGGRSASAMELMQSLRFAEVYNMLGGITDWKDNGYPVYANPTPTITATPVVTTTTTNIGPATFTVSDLHVEPVQPGPDAFFSIVFTVTNISNSDGIYDAAVLITEVAGENRMEIGALTKSVTVATGESKVVTLDEIHLPEGEYNAIIDNQSLFFRCAGI